MELLRYLLMLIFVLISTLFCCICAEAAVKQKEPHHGENVGASNKLAPAGFTILDNAYGTAYSSTSSDYIGPGMNSEVKIKDKKFGIVTLLSDNRERYCFMPELNDSGKYVIDVTNAGYKRQGNDFVPIDVRFTYTWNDTKVDGTKIRPVIILTVNRNKHVFGFQFANMAYKVKVDIFEHGTTTPTSINTSLFFGDIDYTQTFGFQPISGTFKYYTRDISILWAEKKGNTMWVSSNQYDAGTPTGEWGKTAFGIVATNLSSFNVNIVPGIDQSGATYSTITYADEHMRGEHAGRDDGSVMSWKKKVLIKTEAYLNWFEDAKNYAKVHKNEAAIWYNGCLKADYVNVPAESGGVYGYPKSFGLLELRSGSIYTTDPDIIKSQGYSMTNGVITRVPEDKLKYTDRSYEYFLHVKIPANISDYRFKTLSVDDELPPQVTLDTSSIKIYSLDNQAYVPTSMYSTSGSTASKLHVSFNNSFLTSDQYNPNTLIVEFRVNLVRSVIFSGTASAGWYSWKNHGTLSGTYATTLTGEAGTFLINSNEVIIYYPKIETELTVIKTDEASGYVMDGATLVARPWNGSAYTTEGQVNFEWKSDFTYKVTVAPSATNPEGKWQIVEVSAPGAHKVVDAINVERNWVNGVLTDGKEKITKTIEEPFIKYRIWIDKRDYENRTEKVSGATFKAIPMKNNQYTDWTNAITFTEADGYYYADVQPDAVNKAMFRIVETEAPGIYEFTTLQDAGYQIVTDSHGKYCIIKDITIDTYETSTSSIETIGGEEIFNANKTSVITAYNQERPTPADITIKKEDIENNANLEGAVFTVYYWDVATGGDTATINGSAWKESGTLTYDAASRTYKGRLYGYYKAGQIYEGRKRNNGYYKIVETKQPDGYILKAVNGTPAWEKMIHITEDTDTSATGRINPLPENIFSYETDTDLLVKNTPNHLILEKKNRLDEPLQGVVFSFGSSRDTATDYTTNASGIVDIKAISPGTYTFREKSASGDYHVDPTWYTLIVNRDGSIVPGDIQPTSTEQSDRITVETIKDESGKPVWKYVWHIYNDVELPLRMKKVDRETHEEIANEDLYYARFLIYEGTGYEAGTTNNTYKTEPLATLRFDTARRHTYGSSTSEYGFVDASTLEPFILTWTKENQGRFRIVETVAPDGYCVPDDGIVSEFTLPLVDTNEIYCQNVEAENEPNIVHFIKVDPQGVQLEGAVITAWREGDSAVRSCPLNEPNPTVKNKGTLKRLRSGIWHFTEDEAPTNYMLDDTIYEFKVNTDGRIEYVDEDGNASGPDKELSITVVNHIVHPLKLIKIDSETGDVWAPESDFPAGTEFDLFEYNNETGTYESSANQHIIRSTSGVMSLRNLGTDTRNITITSSSGTVYTGSTSDGTMNIALPFGTYTVTLTNPNKTKTVTFNAGNSMFDTSTW